MLGCVHNKSDLFKTTYSRRGQDPYKGLPASQGIQHTQQQLTTTKSTSASTTASSSTTTAACVTLVEPAVNPLCGCGPSCTGRFNPPTGHVVPAWLGQNPDQSKSSLKATRTRSNEFSKDTHMFKRCHNDGQFPGERHTKNPGAVNAGSSFEHQQRCVEDQDEGPG